MRIALIYPATDDEIVFRLGPLPVGLLYIAATARSCGAQVDLFDARFGPHMPSLHQINRYDLIGFTAMSMQVNTALRLARTIRDLGYRGPVAFGGPHASMVPGHLQEHQLVDAIFVGEAERSFEQYLRYLAGQQHALQRIWVRDRAARWRFFPGDGFINDLDTLPFPARDLYGEEIRRSRYINVISARGCPFDCNFCQPTKRILFGNNVRSRSADSIVAELKDCVTRFAIAQFAFVDDTLTFDRARVLDICEGVKPLKLQWRCQSRTDIERDVLVAMRDAGCSTIYIGVESGSQRMLDRMNKRNTTETNARFIRTCNEIGIETHCNILLGYPGETRSDMQMTVDFVRSTRPTAVGVAQVTPFPGTRLWQQHQLDLAAFDWDDMSRHVLWPRFRSMTRQQKTINFYALLLLKEPNEPLYADLLAPSGRMDYLLKKHPWLFRLLTRTRRWILQRAFGYLALARAGSVDAAIEGMKKLLRCDPRFTYILGHLAWLYLSSGQPQEAVPLLRRILRLEPNNSRSRQLLDQLTGAAPNHSTAQEKQAEC